MMMMIMMISNRMRKQNMYPPENVRLTEGSIISFTNFNMSIFNEL